MREEAPIDKHTVSAVLRKAGREAMKYEDGDYFPSTVFDRQASAVLELFDTEIQKAKAYDELHK